MSGARLRESALRFRAYTAGGPGGQHVNKVATAIELRASVGELHLDPDVAERLRKLAGARLNQLDEIVIAASRFRSQERNREDAIARLEALVARAMERPRPRRATRPTLASKERRLKQKSVRSGVKSARARPRSDD